MKTLPLIAALVSSSAALVATGWTACAEAAKDDARSIVWKIQGANNAVYIAGSVHLLRQQDFPIPPSYDEAYRQSKKVVFEIDMADMEGLGAAMKMQQLGSYQNGDSLGNHISEATMANLRNYLKERKLPEAVFMKMKPGLLAMTLSSLEAMKVGARPDLGLEVTFGTRAKKDGVATAGLETIEFQIGLFDGFSDDESDELLQSTLDSLGDIDDSLDKLIAAWRDGDVEKLDSLLNDEFEADSRMREVLLIERNRNWIPEIEKALAGDAAVMFMVGAGHLVGTDGVIELLEARGYKPVQMRYKRAAAKPGRKPDKEQKPEKAAPKAAAATKKAA